MVDSEKSDFALAIGAMMETFGTEATKGLLHGYWMGLCDLDLAAVQKAVALSMRQCDRRPTPADLRRLAGESTSEQQAAIAWGVVLDTVTRCGPYKAIAFQDRAINAVIRNLGGWPNFCERFTNSREEEFARLAFEKTYIRLCGNSMVDGEAGEPLMGLAEEYGSGGFVRKMLPVVIDGGPRRIGSNRENLRIESANA